MKKRRAIFQFILFVILLIALIIILWQPLMNLLSNPDKIRNFVLDFGIFSPLIFIFIVILQIIFAPIPGQVVGLAGGYIFGTTLGTIYSMTGLIIGSFLTFYLARKLGRPFVEKMVNKKTLKKWDKIISNKGILILFWIYLLPALPDDAIGYIAGLTNIKIKNLVLISAIGRFPGVIVLSLMGAGVASQNNLLVTILFITMMIVSIIIYLKRQKLEKSMEKIVKKWAK
jgi:uncharacterized membrane protein YdjX (TVP38/TMEM64 family)